MPSTSSFMEVLLCLNDIHIFAITLIKHPLIFVNIDIVLKKIYLLLLKDDDLRSCFMMERLQLSFLQNNFLRCLVFLKNYYRWTITICLIGVHWYLWSSLIVHFLITKTLGSSNLYLCFINNSYYFESTSLFPILVYPFYLISIVIILKHFVITHQMNLRKICYFDVYSTLFHYLYYKN